MAIPSKELFDAFPVLSAWNVKAEWKTKFRDGIKLTHDRIEKILHEVHKARIEQVEVVKSCPLLEWFEKQPNYVRACSSLYKRKKTEVSRNDQDFFQLWLNYIVTPRSRDALMKDRFDDDQAGMKIRLGDFVYRDQFQLTNRIFEAYEVYYYSDKWREIAIKSRAVREVVREAYEALEKLDNYRVLDQGPSRFKSSIPFGSLERCRIKLLEVLEAKSALDFHVSRLDATTKERGLVFDLAKAIRTEFRTYKPTAIFYLMSIEGVERPLDLRTIERIIEKYKARQLN